MSNSTGVTGSRLLHLGLKGADSVISSPQNLVHVKFPYKTTVTSQQMTDALGRPTYLKDIKA
jgi:hypothetical protein